MLGASWGKKKSTFLRPSRQWRALTPVSKDTSAAVRTGNTHKTAAAADMYQNKLCLAPGNFNKMPSKLPFSSLKGLTCCVQKLKFAFLMFALPPPPTKRNGRGRFTFNSCKSRTHTINFPLLQWLRRCVYTHTWESPRLQRIGKENINGHGNTLTKRNTRSKTPC